VPECRRRRVEARWMGREPASWPVVIYCLPSEEADSGWLRQGAALSAESQKPK